MELDDFKQSWNALDEHLKGRTLVKDEEISRLIAHADKSISAMARLNWGILLISVPLIGFLLVIQFLSHSLSTPSPLILIPLIPALFWDVFTAYYLQRTKIDEMPLIDVIRRINNCQRWLIRERIVSILFILGIATFSFIHWEIWKYGTLVITTFILICSGLTVFTFLIYQYKFMKQIQLIKKNLDELKSLS